MTDLHQQTQFKILTHMAHLTETSGKTIIKTYHKIKVDLNFDCQYI